MKKVVRFYFFISFLYSILFSTERVWGEGGWGIKFLSEYYLALFVVPVVTRWSSLKSGHHQDETNIPQGSFLLDKPTNHGQKLMLDKAPTRLKKALVFPIDFPFYSTR